MHNTSANITTTELQSCIARGSAGSRFLRGCNYTVRLERHYAIGVLSSWMTVLVYIASNIFHRRGHQRDATRLQSAIHDRTGQKRGKLIYSPCEFSAAVCQRRQGRIIIVFLSPTSDLRLHNASLANALKARWLCKCTHDGNNNISIINDGG